MHVGVKIVALKSQLGKSRIIASRNVFELSDIDVQLQTRGTKGTPNTILFYRFYFYFF